MAIGTATIDFGAAPGANDASIDVTGETGILATSRVEGFVRLEATSDHSIEEAQYETLKITCGNIVAGTGFTIYAEVLEGRATGTFKIDWVWA